MGEWSVTRWQGEIRYLEEPPALGPVQQLGMTDPRLYGTPMRPVKPDAKGFTLKEEEGAR